MKKTLFIWPGPLYNLQEYKYNKLSDSFCGHILSFSNIQEIIAKKKIGGFDLHCKKISLKKKNLASAKYIVFCISFPSLDKRAAVTSS